MSNLRRRSCEPPDGGLLVNRRADGRKAQEQERWLAARFPEYRYYRRRVRKLIPFVY